MDKLNQFTLDIEFLLISVVQGVALAALAAASAGIVGDLNFEYWLYIIASFALILNFWSQAIIHAISFIDWPLDLAHNFLYFLASFIEVMAFSYLDDPLRWFGLMCVFLAVAAVLYVIDVRLIKSKKNKFNTLSDKKLYGHIMERQLFELKYIVPSAITFTGGCFVAILLFPELFIQKHWHLALVAIQTIIGVSVLFESIANFSTRAKLVTASRRG